MKVFCIKRSIQACDGDCWYHWIDERIESYYAKKDKAELEVQRLVDHVVQILIEEDPDHVNIDLAKENRVVMKIDTEKFVTVPLFKITEIDVIE